MLKRMMDIYTVIKQLEKDIQVFNTNPQYPTQWVGGKVLGEIVDTDDGCRIIYDGQSRSFKYKNIINSPKMIGCIDKQDCLAKAKKYLYDYYDNLNKIANKYRFLNYNTIEAQLTQDKTFITDSKFLDLINQYRIELKHDKRYDKYYITYVESPKVNKLFVELAFGMSRPKLSNGCDFDLRQENLIETDNSKLFQQTEELNSCDNSNEDKTKLNADGLEMYKWIRGKYAGIVFQ